MNTTVTALKILGAVVVPEKISKEDRAERVSQPLTWHPMKEDLDAGNDEATADRITYDLNKELKRGAILPIPLAHGVYDEILPEAAAELMTLTNDKIFGIDRRRGWVVTADGAFAVRVFWLHDSPSR